MLLSMEGKNKERFIDRVAIFEFFGKEHGPINNSLQILIDACTIFKPRTLLEDYFNQGSITLIGMAQKLLQLLLHIEG